jgi:hypothetical protein
MKTVFTLLLATIVTSAFAYGESRLTINVSGNRNVQVIVDGRTYRDNDNRFVFNNVNAGNHSIQVYSVEQSNYQGRSRQRVSSRLLYSSTVYVRPSTSMELKVNRSGKATIRQTELYNRNDRRNDDRRYDDHLDGDGDYRDDTYRRHDDRDRQYGYDQRGDYDRYGRYTQAMNSRDFDRLVSAVRSEWFASGKLNTAKDGVQRNYLSSTQVRQLLQLFTSDNDKLQLAKLAYDRTVDPSSYSVVYDMFSFQNSRDELRRYIQSSGRKY